MENRGLAAEGVHSAFLSDITTKTAKNSKDFAVLRFQMLGQKASATALLFSGETKAFLQRVPGYRGTAVDELQMLGRFAQVGVIHKPDQNGKVFANVDLASVEWEQEPAKPQEPSDVSNKVVIICGAHPKNGESRTGKYYWRTAGKHEIHFKEAEGRSVFDVVVSGIRSLLRSAVAKKVNLRIFSDVKPAVRARGYRCALFFALETRNRIKEVVVSWT